MTTRTREDLVADMERFATTLRILSLGGGTQSCAR